MKKIVCMILIAVMSVFLLAGCSSGDDAGGRTVVHFLNWGDYIDPEVIPMFEEENPDIKVNMTTVPSNEEMYVIATTEGTQIDIVVPSEYMIQRLMLEDRLAQIDHSKMENYQYVEDFVKTCTYDPDGTYSLPYTWGTFGLLYNIKMTGEEITSWDALFDPKYKNQILMYDSIRDSIGLALIKLGYSVNTRDPQQLDEAADLLVSQKPLVLAYGTDDLRMTMTNGSAALAPMYAGDAAYSMADNEDLRYVVPKEGANIFVDGMCILKTTDAYDASLRFLDFMMRPDIAALNAEYTGYSTPEDAALELVDPELLENYAFNPPKEDLVDCEYYEYLPKDILRLYEDAWMKVKIA
ncbi:MAG: ABC transporter substrate-binding protein [Christensenella sp.]|uniref:ABC transporter substrate-binding protein n=1 Tax=Christensenella sp. TaxID=1935934 RepID=UPI002B20885A|nr:ABC transporter substrate-binding protein [Christensenella sp.]MEA5003199.1 ABC transporter substrate-binding protein [Christensenella sp.]